MKAKTQTKAEKKQAVAKAAVEADVVGVAENLPVPIVKRAEDMVSLNVIESGIRRDIQLGGQLDKASAMVSIKIGIALNSAKDMLRRGEYEPWLVAKFGNDFGLRKSQYCSKLAKVFARETQGVLQLPAPREAGNWLAVQNEGGQLFSSVAEFVGDMTFSELLEKHRIKVGKAKGGWRPSEFMVNRYVMDKPELVGVPFEDWTDEQKDEFRAWADNHNDGDSAEARAMAAEGAWGSIRQSLEDHGMTRASWKLLPQKSLQDVADVLADVLADIRKALKAYEKSK